MAWLVLYFDACACTHLQMLRHMAKVKLRHPPGDEIYRKGNVSMFEVR